MKIANIDLAVREGDARNSLDSIFSRIEKLDLEKNIGPFKQIIENELLYIERSIQDLSDYNDDIYKRFIILSYDCLHKLNLSLSSSISITKLQNLLPIIKRLGADLAYATTVDFENLPIGDKEIKFTLLKNIEYEIDSTIERGFLASIGSFLKNSNFRYARLKHFVKRSLLVYYDSISNITNKQKPIHEDWKKPLLIKLKIKDKSSPQSEIFTLWTLIELLNQVEDVEVRLIKIKKGSILSELMLIFKNEKSKIETKRLLSEIKKDVVEYSRIIKEPLSNNTKSIDDDEEILTDEDAFYDAIKSERLESIRLDNERKQLENDRIKLTNDRLKLENEKLLFVLSVNKKKMLKSLLVREIISRDEFVMLTGGRSFMNFKQESN